jgi:glycosyltransferase involved in cell wall biosynthesis
MSDRPPEKAPIKVAFCHYTSDISGGSDRALLDLVSHLPRDRFEPVMILKRNDPLIPSYTDHNIEVFETEFVPPRRALEPMKLAKFFLSYGPTILRLVRLLRRIQPDVVHVNTLFNVHAPVAARCAGYPLVWHIRELLPNSRIYGVLVWMARHLATRAAVISTAVSEAVAPIGDRRRLVLDGIDIDPYEPTRCVERGEAFREERNIAPGQPVVTVVGRLEPWKGQHVFVEAIPKIRQDFPDAQFLIVGGPAKNKPHYTLELKARCAELGIADAVIFTGILPDIPAVLAASTVLVLPTVTPEPFGLTVPEAMAAARPVVATRAGGPLDSVDHGKTGLLVNPDDPEALAEGILQILSDQEAAIAMGKQGLSRVREKFTIERVADEMATLFQEVHDQASASR